MDNERNEFLRELPWTVIVGTIDRQDGKSVSRSECTRHMIRRSFARRVGIIRGVRRRLTEWRIGLSERPKDFIGRHLEEAERCLSVRRHVAPIGQRGLQKPVRADDVCLNEAVRILDRTIDMTLRGEIEYGTRPVFCQNVQYGVNVRDIGLDEIMALALERLSKILEISGIGQLIDINDRLGRVPEPIIDDIRPDETRAAGNQQHAPPLRAASDYHCLFAAVIRHDTSNGAFVTI